jgi:hypothetical protein
LTSRTVEAGGVGVSIVKSNWNCHKRIVIAAIQMSIDNLYCRLHDVVVIIIIIIIITKHAKFN